MKQSIYKQGILGCLLSLATCGFTACNDQLADELFVKNSYIINNGWKDYHLSVNEDNTALLPIYFGVNGTSTNDKDIVLTMDIDPDTIGRNIKTKKIYTTKFCRKKPTLSIRPRGLSLKGP